MRKRIFANIFCMMALSAFVLTLTACLIFRGAFRSREIESVRSQSAMLAELFNRYSGPGVYDDYLSKAAGAPRLTIIAPDGSVLLDSGAAASDMDNHGGRREVTGALLRGFGEDTRVSRTLGKATYYRAVLLDDGNVLRVSKAIADIDGAFTAIAAAVAAVTALILLLSWSVAGKLADGIIRPVNAIDLDAVGDQSGGMDRVVYDELAPYVKKIDAQKAEIARRIGELRERAGTVEAIIENMREGLVLVDGEGAVLAANKGAAAIFGEPGLLQKDILHVCRDPAFRRCLTNCLAGGAAGGNEPGAAQIIYERGGRAYDVFFSPVKSGLPNASAAAAAGAHAAAAAGERAAVSAGAAILFFDATERRAAEQQRREFTANVSHELKTPLTAICALSELIGGGMAKGADVRGFALKINAQTRRLINTIDDIIKLSELDEGAPAYSAAYPPAPASVSVSSPSLTYPPTPVSVSSPPPVSVTSPPPAPTPASVPMPASSPADSRPAFELRGLAESVRAAFAEKARAMGVSVAVEGGRFAVSADRRMVEELLSNLVDNGIKYNKPGGSVAVGLAANGGECVITVSDTGVGIAEEHQGRVFERFYRADQSRSKKIDGTGLGLSIVKHIALRLGGKIELSSAEGAGTTVTCRLGILA